MVDNDNISSIESVHLMSQHISAFSISVISHHKSLGNLSVRSLILCHLT
jgi:hypothetical protein